MSLSPLARRYLRLLRHALTDWDGVAEGDGSRFWGPQPSSLEERLAARREGRDWPLRAATMIGLLRLEQFQEAIVTAMADGVPGDIVETGVWRGGACILARAVLEALEERGRTVWLADSFAGLPPPRPDLYPADAGDAHHEVPFLCVGRAEVEAAFARHELLDEQVRFLPGWFADTLPAAPVSRLAVLRLDGDMYESTWTALVHLGPRVSPGGFVIVDDYGAIPACRAAVEDYRAQHGIVAPLVEIDWTGRYWRAP